MIKIKGVPASPGLVRGKAVVLKKSKLEIEPIRLDSGTVEKEIRDFQIAVKRVKKELQATASAVAKRLGNDYARIFEAQVMIADDKVVNEQVISRVRQEKISVAYIYNKQVNQVVDTLSQSPDTYLRERITDIESVCHKLLTALKRAKKSVVQEMSGPAVIIAENLSPGDLLGFSVRKKIGFVTETGGKTSHTSLLAKSLDLPAVVGAGDAIEQIETGAEVILDGFKGLLIVNPDKATRSEYRDTRKFITVLKKDLIELKNQQAITKDGYAVDLQNNIELPAETSKVLKSGAEGIGLFRTEYLFLKTDTFPSSAKQFRVYQNILKKMKDFPVTIRTFDVGGDKFGEKRLQTLDPNPFLGWRAIRYCLDNPEIFADQIKALLKASAYGNLKIMLPFISNMDEVIEAKELIKKCQAELQSEGTAFKLDIPLGIMIEVPSAVMLADKLAEKVAFFSIGTNDLIQYVLAVDRTNKMISDRYQALNPAVLQMIKQTITSGQKGGIKVSVCGEMAADPYAVIIFIGLGINELSVNFQYTGIVKRIVRSITFSRAKKIAQKACNCGTASEVEKLLKREINNNFSELVPLIEFVKGGNYD